MDNAFTGIEGKVLESIRVSKDDQYLRLTFTDGASHTAVVEGDCCSYSYWYEILSGKSNLGGKVTTVRVLEMPDVPSEEHNDVTQAYGFAIDTTRGSVVLAFRNDSNGYYGGWAYKISNAPSGTIWRHRVDSNDWRAN